MLFPSESWLAAVVAAVNRHPDLPAALAGLGRDLAAVIEADPPALPAPVAAYARQVGGRIAGVRVLPDPDDLYELEPAYVVRAPYGVWKALLRGDDPVKAALSGRVRVEGDLQALVRRAHYRYVVDAALASIATEFVDERGGRG
ncbi:MAG TPA: SCP2 sterol-binding domain-containing protein [Anaeromyxobacteraceae bacterium]|nr:SCP2 sterol-binding domain-containing protein [Anaeromyxobacteraceae bacterium]